MIMTQRLFVLLLVTLGVACGYSAPKNQPPQPGVVPVVSAIVPASMKAGSPAFMLTVNGSSFAAIAMVNWNGAAMAGTKYITASQLTVPIPASAIATPGTVMVSVTNPGTPGNPGGGYGSGGGGTMSETSASMTFTIN